MSVKVAVGIVLMLIVIVIGAGIIYLWGIKPWKSGVSFEECLFEVRKICLQCKFRNADPTQCPNTLAGKYAVCKEKLNETGSVISDCRKYLGELEEG